MSYYRFIFKKTIKNRGNIISLSILLLLIIALYTMNITSGDSFSYTSMAKERLNESNELIEYYTEELENNKEFTEEDRQSFDFALKDISEQKEWNKQILHLSSEGKWSEALAYSINVIDRHIEVHESSGGDLFPAEYLLLMEKEKVLYENLRILNKEPDTDEYERFGFNYVYRVMDSTFPMFIILILSVFVTEIFLGSYKKGTNIEILLPNSFIGTTMKKIVFTTFLTVVIYLITLIVSFVMASIVSGTGTHQYPILIEFDGNLKTLPIWTVIVKMFLSQSLSIFNVVLFICFVSYLTKNRLTTLLISIVVIIGSSFALKSIAALHPFAHLNPFTYLYSGDVIAGTIISETENTNITFGNGLYIQSLLSIILIAFMILATHKKERKQMIAA